MTSTGLDRDSHVALYIQLAEQLKREINEGLYRDGGRLPSEPALVKRFAVSRVTVRLAIGHLINEGLVTRKQGKGTFVAAQVVRHDLQDLKGFYDVLVAQGLALQTRLLTFEPALPPPEVAAAMATGEAPLYLLRRLYCLDDSPIALATTWLPAAAQQLSWTQAETHPSYSILQHLLELPIAYARVSIRSRLAGRQLAKILELKSSAPVLLLQRCSYGPGDEPREFTYFAVNSNNYEFTLNTQGAIALSSGLIAGATTS
jgi:GntR family transcriptional regulator